LDEMSATAARDASGHGRNAHFETGTLFFLEGPPQNVSDPLTGSTGLFTQAADVNRCVHFAGGRMVSRLPELSDHSADFSLSIMFWNGMPDGARPIAGWMFSHDHAFTVSPSGIHLGLAGAGENCGRLVLQSGTNPPVYGTSPTPRWNWNRAVLVKQGNKLSVYQTDPNQPEIVLQLSESQRFNLLAVEETFFGGRSDNSDNWEGKLDEIAVFDRGLSTEEIAKLLK
jgi:hypothetical protein